MIEVVEVEERAPLCPHCGTEITKLLARKLSGTFGVRYVYFCAHCSKVLGISQRKGFWMG